MPCCFCLEGSSKPVSRGQSTDTALCSRQFSPAGIFRTSFCAWPLPTWPSLHPIRLRVFSKSLRQDRQLILSATCSCQQLQFMHVYSKNSCAETRNRSNGRRCLYRLVLCGIDLDRIEESSELDVSSSSRGWNFQLGSALDCDRFMCQLQFWVLYRHRQPNRCRMLSITSSGLGQFTPSYLQVGLWSLSWDL